MANLFGRDDVALGIALPFGPGRSNFKLNYTTLDQARTNVINLLLTHKGERFMQPEFGTDLRRFLFRQNTRNLADDIRDNLLEAIKFWLPYVAVESVNVDRTIENIEQYIIHVAITFSVTQDISKFTTVTFNFNSSGGVSVGAN
tara:strand:+ start:6522 stop:6953 length:432 start_codon:yes stop_codon:yes gene_type:complete